MNNTDTTNGEQDTPYAFPEGSGRWKPSDYQAMVDELHRLSRVDQFAKGGETWQFVEEINRKAIAKSKSSVTGEQGVSCEAGRGAVRKAHQMYNENHGPCDKELLKRQLGDIRDEIGDDDPHAEMRRAFIDKFRDMDQPARYTLYRLFRSGKNPPEKMDMPAWDDIGFTLQCVLVGTEWGLAQHECLGEHPELKKEREKQAGVRNRARAKTTITVKDARLAETVMVQTAEEICDACETMDPDTDERTKMDNCTDLVYIWCYNSTSRPQDTVAGKAQSSAGQIATSLDGVLELDNEALRARIKYVAKTKHDAARWRALLLPPATTRRLYACLETMWPLIEKMTAKKSDWYSDHMTIRFKKSARWARLRSLVTLTDVVDKNDVTVRTKFSGYALKSLALALFPCVFDCGAFNPKGVNELLQNNCAHDCADSTNEYKKISLGGPKPRAWRKIVDHNDDGVVVEVIRRDGEEEDEPSVEEAPSSIYDESSVTDETSNEANNDTEHDNASIAETSRDVRADYMPGDDEAPAPKRIKVDHNCTHRPSYQVWLDKQEAKGHILEY